MHKDHWRNPRKTIANKFENNDYGYVFHSIVLLKEFLTSTAIHPIDLADKKILDYGCGTGRVTRALSVFSNSVVGYDPTTECIQVGYDEGNKVQDTIKCPPFLTDSLTEVGIDFDIAVCINVLEHLSVSDFNLALHEINTRLKENGECFLWIHVHKNKHFFEKYNILPNVSTNIKIIRGIKSGGQLQFKES